MSNTPNRSDANTQSSPQASYWFDLVNVLKKEVALATEPADACRLYLEIGNIYWHELKQAKAARECFQQGLKLNESYLPLLTSLEKLAVSTQDNDLYQHVRPFLENVYSSGQVPDSKQQLLEFYLRDGRHSLHNLGDATYAIDVLNKASAMNAQNHEVLELLTEAYTETKDWQNLADTYQTRIELTEQDEQYGLRIKLFFLLFYKLNRTEDAIEALKPILGTRPNDHQTLLLINKALYRIQRWHELASNLAHLAKITSDSTLVKAYLLQRAEICHLKCADMETAVSDLRRALEIDPNSFNALERLSTIYRSSKQYDALIQVLQKLIAIHAEKKQLDDLTARALEVARIWDRHLKDENKAIEVLSMAASIAPTSLPIITTLARYYRKQEKWHELKSIYAAELAAADDPNHKLSLYYRIGELLERELDSADEAIATYQEAVALSPNYLPINQRLIYLYEKHQLWSELVKLYEAELGIVDSDNRAISLLNKIALIQADKLSNPTEAARAYSRILSIDPNNNPALMAIGQIYETNEEWDKTR